MNNNKFSRRTCVVGLLSIGILAGVLVVLNNDSDYTSAEDSAETDFLRESVFATTTDTAGSGGCSSASVGDGKCDFSCNIQEHDFDGGDCCLETCKCASYNCGSSGFQCLDDKQPAIKRDFAEVDASKIADQHFTSQFGTSQTSINVRRGLPFTVKLLASELKDRGAPQQLAVLLAPADAPTKGVIAHLSYDNSASTPGSCTSCNGDASDSSGCGLVETLAILELPVDMAVGPAVLTLLGAERVQSPLQVNVLFNPWNSHDPTYLPSKLLRQEHLLEQSAGLCTGKTCGSPVIWPLDQFTPVALTAAMQLIKEMPVEERKDPQHVSRSIAWRLNKEVLKGKWHKPYSEGTEPTAWANSIDILSQYLKTNQIVKYGQCWVFAGVLTTLLRSVGIPTRIVTTERASIQHSRPFDARISRYWHLGPTGRHYHLDTDKSDGMWYFHVWVDAWMLRNDADNVVGWQAVDATPQKWASREKYDGHLVLGPVSVSKVKEFGNDMDNGVFDSADCQQADNGGTACARDMVKFNDSMLHFDMPFVLAEVNADKLQFVAQSSVDPYSFHSYYKNSYGARVMTQQPGTARGTLIDVSCDYKADCGSVVKGPPADYLGVEVDQVVNEVPLRSQATSALNRAVKEQLAHAAARQTAGNARSPELRSHNEEQDTANTNNDVLFEVHQMKPVIPYGKRAKLALSMRLQNSHTKARHIEVIISASTHADTDADLDSTVASKAPVFQTKRTVMLTAEHPALDIEHAVDPTDYRKRLWQQGHNSLAFSVLARVKETSQLFTTLDAFPSVKLAVPGMHTSVQAGDDQLVSVKSHWKNPFKAHKLCGCQIKSHLIGTAATSVKRIGCISPGGHALAASRFKASSKGPQSAVTTITCRRGIFASGFASDGL